jgi:O-6-methylguanine DNA methyltransferase
VVAWNGLGVSAVEAAKDDATFEANHLARTGRPAHPVERVPDRLAAAITRRLEGDRRVRIDLDLRGHTDFQRDVWLKALEIPRGEVRPYGWIAAEIGRPKAVRAVGTALGHNPVPLIVPCHRVVRTDGTIGQYSLGGPGNKRTILSAEGLDPTAMEAAARGGERLSGSTTTRIVCWPTCRHARRVQDRYRVSFRSLGEARARGYRPCKICRPIAVAAAA